MRSIKYMILIYWSFVLGTVVLFGLILYLYFNPPNFSYITKFDCASLVFPTDESVFISSNKKQTVVKKKAPAEVSNNTNVVVEKSDDVMIPSTAVVYRAITNYPVGYYYLQMSPRDKGVYYVYDGNELHRVEFYGAGSNMSPLFYLKEDSFYYTTDTKSHVKLIAA